LENFDLLNSRASTAGKLLRRKNKLYKLERQLVKYLIKSAKKISGKERHDVMKDLYSILENMSNEMNFIELNLYKYFNLKKWVELKLHILE
jgi:hypothetical protein